MSVYLCIAGTDTILCISLEILCSLGDFNLASERNGCCDYPFFFGFFPIVSFFFLHYCGSRQFRFLNLNVILNSYSNELIRKNRS